MIAHKIRRIAMQHKILGILVLCLTLAASVVTASAQDIPDRVKLTTPDGQVIELAEEHEVIAGILRISVEELQRRIDAGEELSLGFDITIRDVVAVDGAVVNYYPPQFSDIPLSPPQFFATPEYREEMQREMQRRAEEQRQREELHREILNDVDISEEDWGQFRSITTNIEEKYNRIAEQLEESLDLENLTPDGLTDGLLTGILRPVFNDCRAEGINFFGNEQYTQLATRLYQVVESGGEFTQFNWISTTDDSDRELSKLFLLPDVIDLTEEQLAGLEQIQREFVAGLFEFQLMSEQEEELLKTQRSEAQTDEERAELQKRLGATLKLRKLGHVGENWY